MKLVIGLVAKKLSGKETFGDMLQNCLLNSGYALNRHRFSDILNETADKWSISRDRKNLQKLAKIMDDAFGKGTLTRAVFKRFKDDPAEIVIADGVRWESDEEMIRGLPAGQSLLIYLTADPQVRYERSLKRKRDGEEKKTFEEFMKEEQASTETSISAIGSRADFTIQNNGTPEKFKQKVEELFYTQILPLLQARE